MNHIDIIGLLAGTLTTISFLPQLIKSWKDKDTKNLSLPMYIIFALGVLTWLIYGIILQALPIIIANAITLVLAIAIIGLKLKYK